MKDLNILGKPKIYSKIENKSQKIGFTMPSNLLTIYVTVPKKAKKRPIT
jgi:hypothetical protein